MAKILPDFSKLVFKQDDEPVPISTPPDLNLLKLFTAVIDQEPIELNQKAAEQMLAKDLLIETKKLNETPLKILGEALIYYTTAWPGWARGVEYHKGQLACKDWFERFRQYLIFKSNFIIKNAPKFIDEIKPTPGEMKEEGTQTDVTAVKQLPRVVAPYTVCVAGPPAVLNNIVFIEQDGNILIKQHEAKELKTLTRDTFLNWPHVSVHVNLPDITITRNNVHRIDRYMTLAGDITLLPDIKQVEHIKKVNEHRDIKPYTYHYIDSYLKQFFQVLSKIPGVKQDRVQQLKTIFNEFMDDIKEANIYNCTMGSNVMVTYNIGGGKYVRNKNCKSESPKYYRKPNTEAVINFYEVVVPQVEFMLIYFSAVQDLSTPGVSFQSLNNLLEQSEACYGLRDIINMHCLIYTCRLCQKTTTGATAHEDLETHFRKEHKAEQSLLCCKCWKQFSIYQLAGRRWSHKCVSKKQKE